MSYEDYTPAPTDRYHFNNREAFHRAIDNIMQYYTQIDIGHSDMIIVLDKGSKIVDEFGVDTSTYELIDDETEN